MFSDNEMRLNVVYPTKSSIFEFAERPARAERIGKKFMTNSEILETAMKQSAVDSNCNAEDFLSEKNKMVFSRKNANARKYLELPFLCDFTSYGSNIVASVSETAADAALWYMERFPSEHCFETPNLYALMEKLHPLGMNVCFMAEYFLPDMNLIRLLECGYEIRILEKGSFSGLYRNEWSNALCGKRRELDCLAAGAFDGGKLVGLAGCSADCGSMWQIGVDVLPEYRRRGIASALTSRLVKEILDRGKVPFYCAAWSNLKSVRNAMKCGLKPAWVQMTVKPLSYICAMNETPVGR